MLLWSLIAGVFVSALAAALGLTWLAIAGWLAMLPSAIVIAVAVVGAMIRWFLELW